MGLVLFILMLVSVMENDQKAELESFLKVLPPVEFCCVYGSALHPNNNNKVLISYLSFQILCSGFLLFVLLSIYIILFSFLNIGVCSHP